MKTPDETLIRRCAETIKAEHKASTSLLQRRHRLGYVCASSILTELEDRGIVGPMEGARPRCVNLDELDAFLENAPSAGDAKP